MPQSFPTLPFSRRKIWTCVIRYSVDVLAYLLSVVAPQTYIAKSKAPLLINSCEFDDPFPPSLAKTADEKFANFAPGYRRAHFDGVHHGFAARGDLVRCHVLHWVVLSQFYILAFRTTPRSKLPRKGHSRTPWSGSSSICSKEYEIVSIANASVCIETKTVNEMWTK